MAYVGLSALDTWLVREWRERERAWREEDRAWRAEDMELRAEEIEARAEEAAFREEMHRWREEDMKQRRIENSRYVWSRFSELNRRDVEEKSEHLRSLSWITGLVTSFTMTAPVEFNTPKSIRAGRLMPYAICTAIVPTLMTTSTIICVYLLGCILRMGKSFVSEHAEEEFMALCHSYAESAAPSQPPPVPSRTFQNFWAARCKDYWNTAFSLFFWGVSFFLALLCTMGFIKFSDDRVALSFTTVIGISFVAWLGIQVKWGYYLKKEYESLSEPVSSHPVPKVLAPDDPYRWHLRPSPDSQAPVSSVTPVLEEAIAIV
ncbi:uncharacterized protein LOC9650622 [Selaginella moellendorffii]|uniref:uncharacterized protein LOC9650622 n=1 Tax=Selaginella moellendorffii TaxID=88036 RepID=UPI000D1C8085|nr:uncharacterized protein LOC9650622 [Selaginella moellendorffii]|eukprot:XP_024532940.1 uncharacterized protein LOC9650622 [Selaginella moellendorffii]